MAFPGNGNSTTRHDSNSTPSITFRPSSSFPSGGSRVRHQASSNYSYPDPPFPVHSIYPAVNLRPEKRRGRKELTPRPKKTENCNRKSASAPHFSRWRQRLRSPIIGSVRCCLLLGFGISGLTEEHQSAMGKVVLRDAIARVGGRRSDGQVSIEVAI